MGHSKSSGEEHRLSVEYLETAALTPHPKNARRHGTKQIAKLAASIREFGFIGTIVIDEKGVILAGHARHAAALQLRLRLVPCLRLKHLSPEQKLAFALADNKLGDLSDFDDQALRAVVVELTGLEFDLELAGFDTAELDCMLDSGNSSGAVDPADTFALPKADQHAVSRLGDLWQLGPHRLLCGNALQPESYEGVLNGAKAELVFTDPPYNVPIQGHVSGLGRTKHREFVEGSGELSSGEFQLFLHQALKLAAAFSQDGAIHFVCMDWRGVSTLLHKHGTAPHRNNVELGKHGRHRTNVWTYPGANAFGPSRAADLAAHPTVKPIGLVADAIRDCSKRGAIVLDPFAGSGTTILAAERTGRRGAAIELDPLYVDTAVRRWQALSGQPGVLASTGRAFSDVANERCPFAQHVAKDGGPTL